MAADEQTMLQEKQMWKAFLASYNKVTEHCFVDCVHDFTTRKVSRPETTCTTNCLQKYLKVTQRITQRISEYQLTQTAGMEAVAMKR